VLLNHKCHLLYYVFCCSFSYSLLVSFLHAYTRHTVVMSVDVGDVDVTAACSEERQSIMDTLPSDACRL